MAKNNSTQANTIVKSNLLPWHRASLDNYWQLINDKKLPHALLFSGDKGIGKLKFAMSLSALLLCEKPSGKTACGSCKPCLLLEKGNHPDFHLITPEDGSKQIVVDQIRSFTEKIYLTASQAGWSGSWKVIIIEPAHVMNINASNSLLKILEEPTKNTLFILVTDSQQSLLATVRSRCQKIQLASPSKELGLQWLDENDIRQKVDNDVLLNRYATQPLLLLSMLNDGSYGMRRLLINFCESILNGNAIVENIAGEIAGNMKDINKSALHWFYEDVHEYFFKPLNDNQRQLLKQDAFTHFNNVLNQAMLEAETNVNIKLMWHNLLLEWKKLHMAIK